MAVSDWSSPDRELESQVNDNHASCLEVYKRDPNRLEEDAGKERGIAEGGYGRKQIQELIQNSADALQGNPGRIRVLLTEETLYVANEGRPFERSGVRALLYTHLSNKTGTEIGRFGLGFKSISGISDGPQIFSRSVSFEFNRDAAARELSTELERQIEPTDVPALRLAWVIDPHVEARTDPHLAEMLRWATTIVKVPLLYGVAPLLAEEIRTFDESFILFAPHVRQLDLEDLSNAESRTFMAAKKGKRVTLTTSDESRDWLVVSKEHRPSRAALESAGHAARRSSVTVSWAVPLTGRPGVGHLSAFFPVKSDVTLSGKINAPWKLSDDRINVIECEFNREILADVLPDLVIDARLDLIAGGGYGRYIEILPARGREERSWADSILNEPVYQVLRSKRCLPDLDGQLRSPASVKRVPEAVEQFTARWLEVTGNRGSWVHPDCTSSKERISKVERLMQDVPNRVGRVTDWLQSVLEKPDAEHSSAAIEMAAGLVDAGGNTELDVRDAKIILLETTVLQQPIRGRCFIRTTASQGGTGFIASEVTQNKVTRNALEHLGITTFDDGGEMLQLLTDLAHGKAVDWDALWIAMRGSEQQVVAEAFEKVLRGIAHKLVRVRDGRGQWVIPEDLYLPGEHLKQVKEDGAYLVDGDYHATDREVLALLGVRNRPTRSSGRGSQKWLAQYRRWIQDTVAEPMGLGPQAREKVEIESISSVLGPLQYLPALSSTNNIALTGAVLKDIHDPRVRVTHPAVTKQLRCVAPEMWWLRQHGILQTQLGSMPVTKVFASSVAEEYGGLLPEATDVILSAEAESVLEMKRDIKDLTPDEFSELAEIHSRRDDEPQVGHLYAWWCHTHPENPPNTLWVRGNDGWQQVDRTKVAAVNSSQSLEDLKSFNIPAIVVSGSDDVYNLQDLWGCLEGRELPLTYTYETSAEPEVLADVYEVLENIELEEDPADLQLQRCLSLSKVATIPNQPEIRITSDYGREGNKILVTGQSERTILKQVLACLVTESSDERVDALLTEMQGRRNNKKVREIRAASTDAERLLQLVGEERLRSLVPKDALSYLATASTQPPGGIELANLCITMLGTRALERACKVDPNGLPMAPPSQWHGSYNTRKWVQRFGFSDEWAGQRARKRNKPAEYVEGPTQLKELHDYQQIVSERLTEMLIGTGPNRGYISLPTGAGKTRVAVQTIIEAIRDGLLDRPDGSHFTGPVLWVADGEELCEQAIDAWSYLWRAVGRQDTQLVLSRFWSNYETEEETSGVQVVVTTWQKLIRVVKRDDFDWLAQTPVIIIDEAHGALHRSYTEILEWAGYGNRKRDKPLLGLTATPFRGRRDSSETQRLQRRFDGNRLDEGVFGTDIPQLRLQRDRVLAKAQLEILDGVSIKLSPDEISWFREKYWLPSDAAKRLGRREDRTRLILESILSKPKSWPILVFAASVESAQTLATLLTLEGRPAASIDQDTNPEDRRSAIERFKSGDLKVLTNYSVLSQGFDAPMTRAVYITRPTSSEVRYQQMVGRGLRGPRNGGTDDVLIVNVLDNLVEFGDSIVFQSLQDIIDAGQNEDADVDANA